MASNKQIVLGADHAGFELKSRLKTYLEDNGYDVTDIGCHSTDSVDYPKIGYTLAETMRSKSLDRGLLVCGSGIGICMAANRFPHIRAAVARDVTDARLSRRHNDCNVLCLGGRISAPDLAIEILDEWLETPFDGGRHETRTKMLDCSPEECTP